MKRKTVAIVAVFAAAILVVLNSIKIQAKVAKEGPIVVASYGDLCDFRDRVNAGEDFKGITVIQTADIHMDTADWIPIGIARKGNYFRGVYNGNGHEISGLRTKAHPSDKEDALGLFGELGGVVMNLRLTDVLVNGGNVAGIAALSEETEAFRPAIFSCSVSGRLVGESVGGIANAFSGGVIANCIADVTLHLTDEDKMSETDKKNYYASNRGAILGRYTDAKVYGCFAVDYQVMPNAILSATSGTISRAQLRSHAFNEKLAVYTELTQAIFADGYDVSLLKPETNPDETVGLTEPNTTMRKVIAIGNAWLPILLAVLVLVYVYVVALGKNREKAKVRNKAVVGIAVIAGIAALFVDCATIAKPHYAQKITYIVFLILLNYLFAFSTVTAVRRKSLRISRSGTVTMAVIMGVTAILAVLQFGITPIYDAGIYYGSLTRGVSLYRLDLLSFISSFVLWKWTHGSALLIAPLEFFFPGKMIGLYISNVILMEVTLVIMYLLLRSIFKTAKPVFCGLCAAVLVFLPFQLGMFTYLSWDNYLVYYGIWLLYAFRKKNPVLVGFCGFLMAFTKISGLAFYVVFLLSAAFYEMAVLEKGTFGARLKAWWKWDKVILWILPALLYLLTMVFGEYLTAQNFYGANIVPSIAAKEPVSLLNTLIQSFVFAFRWLFVLLILASLFKMAAKKRLWSSLVDREGSAVLLGAALGSFAVVGLLLLYNSDAECPRYTAPMNIFYALWVPLAVQVLFRNQKVRTVIASVLVVLFLVQTYWTIDPSVILHKTAIETGEKSIYKLALDDDDRIGMNLGQGMYGDYSSVGDIYAYNLEYSYYNDLLQRLMTEIRPAKGDMFYSLDVIDYEFHIKGNKYPVYWQSGTHRFTYTEGENGIYLNGGTLSTPEIEGLPETKWTLGNRFYLVVAPRVDASRAFSALNNRGYSQTKQYYARNIYGALTIYQFTK